jgi:hypothetical protein
VGGERGREERRRRPAEKKRKGWPDGLLSHDGTVARFGGVFKIVAADEAKERGKKGTPSKGRKGTNNVPKGGIYEGSPFQGMPQRARAVEAFGPFPSPARQPSLHYIAPDDKKQINHDHDKLSFQICSMSSSSEVPVPNFTTWMSWEVLSVRVKANQSRRNEA